MICLLMQLALIILSNTLSFLCTTPHHHPVLLFVALITYHKHMYVLIVSFVYINLSPFQSRKFVPGTEDTAMNKTVVVGN